MASTGRNSRTSDAANSTAGSTRSGRTKLNSTGSGNNSSSNSTTNLQATLQLTQIDWKNRVRSEWKSIMHQKRQRRAEESKVKWRQNRAKITGTRLIYIDPNY